MSDDQANKVYNCGLCDEEFTVSEIQSHKCFEGSSSFFIMADNKMYPHKGTKTMEEMLIAAVKDRPQIWNHKDFTASERSIGLRHQLWEEVTNTMNADNSNQYTTNFLKTKWKNLCDSYRVFLVKDQKRKCKPWKYMHQMAFTRNVIENGGRKTAHVPIAKSSLKEPVLYNEPTARVSGDLSGSNDELDVEQNETVNRIIQSLNKPIPTPQLVLPSPPPLPEKDEIASFCLMIDKKLRKLSREDADKVMFQIHELIFRFEHKKKNDNSSTKNS